MKICWDNIKNIKLTRRGNFRINEHTYLEYDACLKCGDPFLGRIDTQNSRYCDGKCVGEDKIITALTRQKMKENHFDVSGNKNPNWKGGVKRGNIPLYDTYAPQLELYEECRHSTNNQDILEVKCTYCGKWYIPTLKSVKYRLQGINGNDTNRLYCSTDCKQECPIFWQQKYYKGQGGYSSREVQPQLRQIVFERDGYICVKCGNTGPLHCHHIDPVINNPVESADVDNCVTLCAECHQEVHSLPGCKYNELRKC